MITILHRGGGGSLGTPKTDYVICARPLTPMVSAVSFLSKHLHFNIGVAVSQQREDKTQHSIDVPLKRLQIKNRRWKTPTKRPPSSSKLGSAGRCLAGRKKWSTPSHPVPKCRGWPWFSRDLWCRGWQSWAEKGCLGTWPWATSKALHCRVENPTQTRGLPPMTSTL